MSSDGSSTVTERRLLLEHVLEVHKGRGGKVDLPIGMTTAEPWILDHLDVVSLLAAVSSNPKGKVDLISFCKQGNAKVLQRLPSARRSFQESGELSDDVIEPQLNLPQLSTGLSEAELKDLAYLVFSSNCRGSSTADELLSTVRSQLDIDSGRAEEVERLLQLAERRVSTPGAPAAANRLPVSEGWTGSLELPVVLLRVVRPRDFRRFRSFVTWRDTLGHVLSTVLWATCRDSWAGGEQEGPSAQQLLARLKAGLRRADVRSAEDFDEEEYSAAVGCVAEVAQALERRCQAGWRFPWGMRVRLAEMLLRGVFDTVEEASYIPGVNEYLKLLETRVWPLLGISPAMHNAGFAWVHFRQFVLTQDPPLLNRTKALLQRLSQYATPRSTMKRTPSSTSSLPLPSSGNAQYSPTLPSEARPTSSSGPDDATLTQEVGNCVIAWVKTRLADYHQQLEGLGGAAALPGLVEVMSCGALSSGASLGEVHDQLVAALHTSIDAELQRRHSRLGPFPSHPDELKALADTAKELAEEEASTWAAGFSSQLPEAAGLALARLHGVFGRQYLQFMAQLSTLDDDNLAVIHAAWALEPALLGPVRDHLLRCQHPSSRELLAACRTWDTPLLLQPVLATWVDQQTKGFMVWVGRQLEHEAWRPVGGSQGYSNSAHELRRIIVESLDVLFGMELPVPTEILAMHMEGIEAVLQRYLSHIKGQLGRWERLVPAVPPLTRYKQEVAVAQEAAEVGLPGLPNKLPPAGARTKKGEFLDMVQRTQYDPSHQVLQEWSIEKLLVMLCSLGYLLDTLQPVAASVQERWQQAISRLSSGQGSGGFPVSLTGSPYGRSSTQEEGYGALRGSGGAGGSAGSGSGSGAFGRRMGGSGNWYSLHDTGGSTSGRHNSGAERRVTSDCGRAWGGGWQQGVALAGVGGARVQELFGTMLEAAEQSLRAGISYVAKWLVTKVVWWDLRGEWCELLYRHRVSNARLDSLLKHALNDALTVMVELLPDGGFVAVAGSLLRECCLALERVLLDGGHLRQFVPADVEALKDDLHALKELFVADGQGLPLREVEETLAGLRSLLALMEMETGDLTHHHSAAMKRNGYTSSPRAVGGASPFTSPREQQVQTSGTSSSISSKASKWRDKGKALLGPLHAGFTGSSGAAGEDHGGGSGAYSVQATGQSYSVRGMAAAGGYQLGQRRLEELLQDDQVLLRVLCHRADHPASKYVKEACRVRKPREETVGEMAKRILNFH